MNSKENLISLFEYEKTEKLNSKEKKEIDKINKIANKNLFDFTRNGIKAKQYIGFCQIGKRTIEVLPKIFNKGKEDEKLIHKGLLFMLSTTKKLKISETEISNLSEKENSLFEIFIYLFSKNLLELLNKDFKRNYINKEENLNFIKGKINFIKNIRYNLFNKAKNYCSYDEFEENNLMNQILKSCVKKLIKLTKSNNNFNLLRKCDLILNEVEFIKFQNSKVCDKVKFTRLNFEYKETFNLAKLLLFGNSPSSNINNFETFSFMFDMNKLFEEFIFEMLKNIQSEKIKNIQSEKPRLNIFTEINDNKETLFQLKPDILINVNKEKTAEIILDTKYKKISENEKKMGISQSDVYQLFTYSKYYNSTRNILLYPEYIDKIDETFKNDNNENEKNFSLKIKTINLNLDKDEKLKEYQNKIKKKLMKLIDKKINF
jgi:5-methylcytosine-specific restriction enzyme subunit McrC